MNESSIKKVFISYAKDDYPFAEKLYNDLKIAKVNAWIDRENILPGENWKIAISNAIKESSYFLVLLSSNSISKKGYIQKELKIALELLEQLPSSGIFIIPVRIDDCNPRDEQLQNLHFADFFPSYDNGLERILKVINNNCESTTKNTNPIKTELTQLRENLISSQSTHSLRKSLYEVECYLSKQPYNVEAKILKDQIEQSIIYCKNNETKNAQRVIYAPTIKLRIFLLILIIIAILFIFFHIFRMKSIENNEKTTIGKTSEILIGHLQGDAGESTWIEISENGVIRKVPVTLIIDMPRKEPRHYDFTVSFDITNNTNSDMRIVKIWVSTNTFSPLEQIVRYIPYPGLGEIRKFFCSIDKDLKWYPAEFEQKGKYVLLKPKELETIELKLNTLTEGKYDISVILEYSTKGKSNKIEIGPLNDIRFLNKKRISSLPRY